jgi:hypothetical protein
MNPKTHTHIHTTVCFLFFVLFFVFWKAQTTNPTDMSSAPTSQAQWQKALAGLSTCTPAGLMKPRHLFWGPPRSQTGALPLTQHHPWGLGHNCVWKACSKLDTLSLIRLDNNNNNNSFIHSFTWCCCYSKRFRSCHRLGWSGHTIPLSVRKFCFSCGCVCVFRSFFPWHQSAHHPDSLRSHGLCMYARELRMGKRERERERRAEGDQQHAIRMTLSLLLLLYEGKLCLQSEHHANSYFIWERDSSLLDKTQLSPIKEGNMLAHSFPPKYQGSPSFVSSSFVPFAEFVESIKN